MPEPIPLTPRQIYSRAYHEANKAYEKEKMRAWREANKDAIKERQRAWYEANKEATKEKKSKWREANPEYKRAWREANPDYDSTYYEANKEACKEQMRAWFEANPEKARNARAKRRANTVGEISLGWIPKLLELQHWTCVVCNKDLRFGYHIDHVYPIARGGENADYNLQALCPKCNLEKSDKDPIDFMQSRGFLI